MQHSIQSQFFHQSMWSLITDELLNKASKNFINHDQICKDLDQHISIFFGQKLSVVFSYTHDDDFCVRIFVKPCIPLPVETLQSYISCICFKWVNRQSNLPLQPHLISNQITPLHWPLKKCFAWILVWSECFSDINVWTFVELLQKFEIVFLWWLQTFFVVQL